ILVRLCQHLVQLPSPTRRSSDLVLLQVFDDGRLTDGQGRVVNFANTLIILTSNLGSQFLSNLDEGQTVADVEPQVMDVVRAHFQIGRATRLNSSHVKISYAVFCL